MQDKVAVRYRVRVRKGGNQGERAHARPEENHGHGQGHVAQQFGEHRGGEHGKSGGGKEDVGGFKHGDVLRPGSVAPS